MSIPCVRFRKYFDFVEMSENTRKSMREFFYVEFLFFQVVREHY